MIAIRLIAGHFFPELGGKKVKAAVSKVIPVHFLLPRSDQVPLSSADYRRIGFPDARPSGSWVRQDLGDFHRALESMHHDYRGSYPGADGDYGKSVFSKITKLEIAYKSLPLEEQGEVIDLIANIHEVYRHAHNIERIQYDREISLLRGIYVAMMDHFLDKVEREIKHLQNEIADATGMLGFGSNRTKTDRRIMAETLLQYTSNSMSPGLFEMRKSVENFVEETVTSSSIRPQSKKLTLRFLERHLGSIGKRIGGDYKKSIEKGYRRSSDPEIKELYRRILLTF